MDERLATKQLRAQLVLFEPQLLAEVFGRVLHTAPSGENLSPSRGGATCRGAGEGVAVGTHITWVCG